jgi:isobutyryl-CoA mutase
MSQIVDPRLRIVTAGSLFDGHDAAINIMRRIMQSKGVEVIHLGHNRSVHEIVECAIEEGAQAIAITSYQGGHVEFFKYMKDLLDKSGCGHIKIFGGGGGTILPSEINELQHYGITRIYSPDDGRKMGLEGMIEDLISHAGPDPKGPRRSNRPDILTHLLGSNHHDKRFALGEYKDIIRIAEAISKAENGQDYSPLIHDLKKEADHGSNAADATMAAKPPCPVIGITGTGGAGKSSVTDEILRRFLHAFANKTVAVLSVDPSRKKTGGALLGDRIRMNSISSPRVYMRSLATREDNSALSKAVKDGIEVCRAAAFDLIILESAGVGQSDASILDYCDVSIYIMTPEYGAASQLEKINMLDYADILCINKFDKAGALDALSDVKKQYRRNHGLWNAKEEDLPVVGTMASHFNDPGINNLFAWLLRTIKSKCQIDLGDPDPTLFTQKGFGSGPVIPPSRVRYLSDIAENNRNYDHLVKEQSAIASKLYQLQGTLAILKQQGPNRSPFTDELGGLVAFYENQLTPVSRKLIRKWGDKLKAYEADYYEYRVRDKTIRQEMFSISLSGTRIPKVVLPKYADWGDILKWQAQENVPGSFPFTAGVFPLKREGEDPTRMFAGEGSPERTNKRFHYLSFDQPAKRLSTAFDSVTLYGEDPDQRPDIYGKIGNSGVSIATIDDAKKLYSGFDLCDPKTSVSMTINGPAPIILAFFLNAAIDQQCEKYLTDQGQAATADKLIKEKFRHAPRPTYYNPNEPGRHPVELLKTKSENVHEPLGLSLLGTSGDEVLPPQVYDQIREATLSQVRGTVQADILKEDQAQNTCIFSTEFALKLMGDVQEYFIRHRIQNFYSVSISGYHIAEAGANPITQLAFTLANGFTYVEYYLSRGMKVDEFAPNLSFFFSNGMDPEYSVIGRVARRIWAKAMKYRYKANKRSQMLKYHIQTSGRSLHAQEIDFNDIRTTLQALYAIYDNCNSLHTNAYDEAITTPTEESVRRAMAIQLIINRELGSAKTENFIQGSFLIEELTDLVEEAILVEFDRLTDRGSVLGAMERMYQRNKIQEESLQYESLKHSGELPIVGVNTFLNKKGSPTIVPREVIRSTQEEKEQQIQNLQGFKKRNQSKSEEKLSHLQAVVVQNGNIFEELMETVKFCSLGQITHALYQVGGQYRRTM